MPGTVRVTVQELVELRAPEGKKLSIQVVLGDKSEQTLLQTATADDTQPGLCCTRPFNVDFVFTSFSLKDDLEFSLLDARGISVGTASIPVTAIVSKGSRDELLPFSNGGRLRAQTSFSLSEEERARIAAVRSSSTTAGTGAFQKEFESVQSLGEAGRRHTAGAGSTAPGAAPGAAGNGAPAAPEPGRVMSTPSGDISLPTASLNPDPQSILAEVRARQGRVGAGGENGSGSGNGAGGVELGEEEEMSREAVEALLGISKPAAAAASNAAPAPGAAAAAAGGEASSSREEGEEGDKEPRKGRPLRKLLLAAVFIAGVVLLWPKGGPKDPSQGPSMGDDKKDKKQRDGGSGGKKAQGKDGKKDEAAAPLPFSGLFNFGAPGGGAAPPAKENAKGKA